MSKNTTAPVQTPADLFAAAQPDADTLAAYAAADASGKGKIRATVDKAFKAAFMAGDFAGAAAHKVTLDNLQASKPAKQQVDPKQVLAQRAADLIAAAHLILTGQVTPTDLTVPDWTDADFVDGFLSLPTVDADGDAARKIAGQKITKTELRRSIQQVIDNAFADLSDGDFLTVAEIRKAGCWEGYVPSDGAIAARLFPRNGGDCTLDGVEPVAAAAGIPAGARKVDA